MTAGPKSGMHAELSHARNGLYRSLRHPILIDTGLVSARKHENFEDLLVSLLSLLEYISRTFSTRCPFVPSVARSQWCVVHGQCAGGKTSSDWFRTFCGRFFRIVYVWPHETRWTVRALIARHVARRGWRLFLGVGKSVRARVGQGVRVALRGRRLQF